MEEALFLLREREMERTRPTRNDRAAKALLDQLCLLNEKYRIRVSEVDDWNELEVQLPKLERVSVVYDQQTGITIRTTTENRVEIELDYDPDTKQYVGRQPDLHRVPKPGDVALRRRPALAVLVEKIIELAKTNR